MSIVLLSSVYLLVLVLISSCPSAHGGTMLLYFAFALRTKEQCSSQFLKGHVRSSRNQEAQASLAQYPSHGRQHFCMSVRLAPAVQQHLPKALRTVAARQSSAWRLLWRALAAKCRCRGCRVICQQISLLSVGGNTRMERAAPGMWAGTPGPVNCSSPDGCPTAICCWPRQPPPPARGIVPCLVLLARKNRFGLFATSSPPQEAIYFWTPFVARKMTPRSRKFGYNWPPRNTFFLPGFVTRLLTPRPRKFGYGLLLGCRSPLSR